MFNYDTDYHVYDGDQCVMDTETIPEELWVIQLRPYVGDEFRTTYRTAELLDYQFEAEYMVETGYDSYGQVTIPSYYNVVDDYGKVVAMIPAHVHYYGTDAVDYSLREYYKQVAELENHLDKLRQSGGIQYKYEVCVCSEPGNADSPVTEEYSFDTAERRDDYVTAWQFDVWNSQIDEIEDVHGLTTIVDRVYVTDNTPDTAEDMYTALEDYFAAIA